MTGKPFQVIHFDSDSASFIFDEKRYIEEMVIATMKELIEELPVALISIAGPTRHGKSFLMNFLLRYLERFGDENWIGDPDEPLTGFPWKEGCDAVTEGIILSPPFIMTRKDGSRIVVILMDTQGLFDDLTDLTIAEHFYAISTIISSTQIYNLKANILTNDISILSKYSKHSKELSDRAGHDELQKLLFIVRDWPNENEFAYGFTGGEKFLAHKMDKQREKFWKEWHELRECTSQIECFMIPTRGDKADEGDFQGEWSKLKVQFVDSIKELVPKLLSPDDIKVKSEGGEVMPFRSIFNLFKELAIHLAEHKSVNGLEQIKFKAKVQDAFGSAKSQFLVRVIESYKAETDMKKAFDKAEEEALNFYSNATQFIPGLDDLLNEKVLELIKFFAESRDEYQKDPPLWIETAYEKAKSSLYNVNWTGVLSVVGAGLVVAGCVAKALCK